MIRFLIDQVYVYSRGVVGGKLEAEGPLKNYFDELCCDDYVGENSFEKGEQMLVKKAIDYALRKANLDKDDIDLLCGGDLVNQISTSNYVARNLKGSFIGMYAACATSSLVIGEASFLLAHSELTYALAFTSSHMGVAQRQFRFPNSYGIQKKETTTTTVTGAGAMILSKIPSSIQVKEWVVGRVKDILFKDVNDMGSAMAPAVFALIDEYLKTSNQSISDFDLIVTGDLSFVGIQILKDLLLEAGYQDVDRVIDCGLMIYDRSKQDVFYGGSGCACSMCVSLGFLLKQMEDGIYQRIMVVASGALLTPILSAQKESIPCIAHGIVYERSKQ